MKKILLLFCFLSILYCSKDSGPATFLISIDAQDGGTVSTSGGEYEEGSKLSIRAVPDQGFDFAGWTGGASGNTNPLTITVDSNANITGTFVRSTYNLNVTVDGQGTVDQKLVSSARKSTDYESFSKVKLTATPSSNWIFYKWSGASNLTNPQVEIEMDSSKDITASFQEIFLQPTQNGVNFVEGKWKLRKNGSQTVASKNDNECEITEVVFRSNGTFTFYKSDGEETTGTYNFEEQQDSVFIILLFVGETGYGSIQNIIVTNNYISFSIASPDCEENIEADKDENYKESEDPLANCSILSTLDSGPESQTVSHSTSIASVTYSFSATCSFSLSASASNLPRGVTMSFSENKAVISGSPTQAGTFDYEITVVDTISSTTSVNGSIIVEAEPDTTPPTILINGAKIIVINLGDTYNELGADASDNVDGAIQVVISGSVNTSTAGNYTLTYTATDSSGNSVSTTRTVRVVCPSCDTNITIVSGPTVANGSAMQEWSISTGGPIQPWVWSSPLDCTVQDSTNSSYSDPNSGISWDIPAIVVDGVLTYDGIQSAGLTSSYDPSSRTWTWSGTPFSDGTAPVSGITISASGGFAVKNVCGDLYNVSFGATVKVVD